MNRCLTEGRRSFLERLRGIETGAECERLAPQLSALADREAGGAELSALRAHLGTCLACRARLREFRRVPSHVAALVPPAALALGGEDQAGALRGIVESLLGATQHKAAALGERAHGAIELATGQKVAAAAASAAVLAGGGGGAAVERLREREAGAAPAPKVEKVEQKTAPPAPAPKPPAAAPTFTSEPPHASAPAPQPAPQPPAPKPAPLPPDPANEFAPAAAAAAPAPAPPPAPAGGEFAPGGGGGGGGEFGP